METLKIGMVGLDTSHCVAFTRIFNDAAYEYYIPGARVVAAYGGGSALFSLSRERVKGYTEELTGQYGIALYEDIHDLARDVDALLLESVDGRQHLEQFRAMAVGKPVFIDKPLAVSTADAREILVLAEETHTPIMSCSSLRYAAGLAGSVRQGEQVVCGEAFGPAPILEDYPGLFWYGIHSAEILFSLMGAGCKAVRCIAHQDMDVAIGEWKDGRLGVMRGTRFEKNEFGCVVHTDGGTRCAIAQSTPPYYFCLLQRVTAFFESGVSPVDTAETMDIIAFLEAADRSKAQGGKVVRTEPL
jgi:hypothetical protein